MIQCSLLISFWRFSTEPGLGRPSALRQSENRRYTFVRGERAEKEEGFEEDGADIEPTSAKDDFSEEMAAI